MRKRNRQKWILWIFLVVLAVFLAGCGNNEDSPYDPDYVVSTPVNLTASGTYPDYIELTWEVPNKNDKYCNIYRQSDQTGSERDKIDDTNLYSYKDDSLLLPDTLYTYFIEPVSCNDIAGQMSDGIQGSVQVSYQDATAGLTINENPRDSLYRYKWYRFMIAPVNVTINWTDNNTYNSPGDFVITIYDNNLQQLKEMSGDNGFYIIDNIVNKYTYCYVRITLYDSPLQTINYKLDIT